jgi:hypothetical protein
MTYHQKNDNSQNQAFSKKHTIKEIVEKFFVRYTKSSRRNLFLKDKHFHAINNIRKCRTKELGYTLYACEDCGEAHFIYRSCGHRFCPTCGIINTNKWAEKTLANLLDIKHHHVVVTLPAWLRPIARRNNKLIYSMLLKASWLVIKNWFQYKYQIEPGVISVLHTAGSDLKYHPHIHMIVTGGGINHDNNNEIQLLEGDYLFDHKWFRSRFRWEFQQLLIKAFDKKELELPYHLQKRPFFLAFIKKNNNKDKHGWIVSVQAPLQNASSIVKYVGRYTKRACLSEYKIQDIKGDFIAFNYNDYKNTPKGQKPKIATIKLHYVQFLDRLLLHVPDKGSRNVRYYGIYSSSKMKNLPNKFKAKSTQNIDNQNNIELLNFEGDWEKYQIEYFKIYGKDPLYCEHCKRQLTFIHTVLPFHSKQINRQQDNQTMKKIARKSRNKAVVFDDDR